VPAAWWARFQYVVHLLGGLQGAYGWKTYYALGGLRVLYLSILSKDLMIALIELSKPCAPLWDNVRLSHRGGIVVVYWYVGAIVLRDCGLPLLCRRSGEAASCWVQVRRNIPSSWPTDPVLQTSVSLRIKHQYHPYVTPMSYVEGYPEC